MYLISIGKNTVLSEFDTLATKFIYNHSDAEIRDFQYYPSKPIFIEVDKMTSLEVLRVKQNYSQGVEIQRVRKLNVDNVYCVACGKQSVDEMALGLSTGHLKVYNYRSSEFVHTFKPSKININKTCILYADYNASDDFIASVYESGEIHVYGVKTKAKTDTINVDGNSTMARFHPSKRFQLSIASQKGTVTIFDIQSKRKLFHCLDAHAAPCRDLCMSKGAPDTMISVGYDCIINIYDTRRKSHSMQLTYMYPMSTVAMSDCGTYFCVGNLKGELTSFDMRNTKESLYQNKVHDCAVGRVAFVAAPNESQGPGLSGSASQTMENDEKHDLPTYNSGASGDVKPVRSSLFKQDNRRDSFGAFMHTLDVAVDGKSMGHQTQNLCKSYDWSILKADSSCGEQSVTAETNNRFQFVNTIRGSKSRVRRSSQSVSSEGRSFDLPNGNYVDPVSSTEINSNEITLGDILEEPIPISEHYNSIDSYERMLREEEEMEWQVQNEKLKPVNMKAVDVCVKASNDNLTINDRPKIIIEAPANKTSSAEDLRPRTPLPSSECAIEPKLKPEDVVHSSAVGLILQEIKNLRNEMNKRMSYLEGEIKFNAEQNKWQIFTQNSSLYTKHEDNCDMIINALDCMLQQDPFVADYLRLRSENTELKARLEELIKNQQPNGSS